MLRHYQLLKCPNICVTEEYRATEIKSLGLWVGLSDFFFQEILSINYRQDKDGFSIIHMKWVLLTRSLIDNRHLLTCNRQSQDYHTDLRRT